MRTRWPSTAAASSRDTRSHGASWPSKPCNDHRSARPTTGGRKTSPSRRRRRERPEGAHGGGRASASEPHPDGVRGRSPRGGTGMTLQVVGAGIGRTGTHSLKLALERLLGGPCYHMLEVFGHPEDVDVWRRAAEGEAVDWSTFPEGYVASVD